MNERIEKIVNDELKSGNLAGVSICAIKNGKEIYNKQFGYSNLEERTKVKRDTIYNIYSMSKLLQRQQTCY